MNYASIFYDDSGNIIPFIKNFDTMDEYNFDYVMPIFANEFGEIEFLESITVSGSVATTGKGLSDIITINDTDIIVGKKLSDSTAYTPVHKSLTCVPYLIP